MFNEKPPFLSGNSKKDLQALRDYLFRLAGSLADAAQAPEAGGKSVSVSYTKDGKQVLKPVSSDADAITQMRQNAQELRSLIIKSASNLEGLISEGDTAVMQYADSKTEEYNSMYVAQSEFGTFRENINTVIETTAQGVVESYHYGSSIQSLQSSIDLLQGYYSVLNGEIRRGIVQIPGTNPPEYDFGIAISRMLQYEEGECGPSDPNNPGDGYTYYYIKAGQTFGLYTSTGWQFWVNGFKRGWYDSEDGTNGMLHVASALVESSLHIGTSWEIVSIPGTNDIELRFIGGQA